MKNNDHYIDPHDLDERGLPRGHWQNYSEESWQEEKKQQMIRHFKETYGIDLDPKPDIPEGKPCEDDNPEGKPCDDDIPF